MLVVSATVVVSGAKVVSSSGCSKTFTASLAVSVVSGGNVVSTELLDTSVADSAVDDKVVSGILGCFWGFY